MGVHSEMGSSGRLKSSWLCVSSLTKAARLLLLLSFVVSLFSFVVGSLFFLSLLTADCCCSLLLWLDVPAEERD